ncbi:MULTISPECIES: flavin reductase family protein [Pantoea]|nr:MULTISPECIES: iron-sulfur cluster-binding domain-containing protein [Pantoea]PNK70413.1 hypothetical protein A6J33_002590 [Pantoea sp. FDAARGOS_194]
MKRFVITTIRSLGEAVREFTLDADNNELALLTPGAHYRWQMPDGIGARCYSCVMLELPATALTFAVRLSPDSLSSGYLSGLAEGDIVTLEGPFNHFPQLSAPLDGRDIVIAGGIGITPLTGIVTRLVDAGRQPECHYFASSRSHAAYSDRLESLTQERFRLHTSEGPRITIEALLGKLQRNDRIHVCGPARLLSAVLDYCDAHDFPRSHLAFEIFNALPTEAETGGYEVEATETGVRFQVTRGQSLLDALEEAGLEPLYDCRRGECGLCALEVVEGEVEHRDFIMTPQEAATSRTIYPCVSRAKGSVLKLAL